MTSRAEFVEPMLALAVAKLPEGATWSYELKFDGYRAIGLKAGWSSPTLFTERQRFRQTLRFDRRRPRNASRGYGY
jgi:ATP-dependent DNA ligase